MKSKIIYLLTGLILFFANFSFRVTTIDPLTLSLIEEVEAYDSNKLWEGFEMSSYPKDIWYNFNKEFRYEGGKITAKKPDQPVISIEALKLNGLPLIKAVPFDKVRTMYEAQTSASMDDSKTYYKSVLIHESFHCYQMSHGLDVVHDLSETETEIDEEYDEFMAAIEKLNQDKTYGKLWEAEYMALLELYETGDAGAYKLAKAHREDYIKETSPKLSADLISYMTYKEFIEGTAQFVQDKYIANQTGKDEIKHEDRVFYRIDKTFYAAGSLKARILDKYYKAWREGLSFDMTNNFDKIMERGNIL